jgi:hypothetical protein
MNKIDIDVFNNIKKDNDMNNKIRENIIYIILLKILYLRNGIKKKKNRII